MLVPMIKRMKCNNCKSEINVSFAKMVTKCPICDTVMIGTNGTFISHSQKDKTSDIEILARKFLYEMKKKFKVF